MENKNNPLVSIIIPVYNRAELLPRTLKSVVNQTYRNIEIIVVDDGSDEDIKIICDRFNDPRIRYIRHTENKGLPSARNTGIRMSKGDFITFLDSDDEYIPERIDKQVKFFTENRDIQVVYCSVLEEKKGKQYLRKIIGDKWFVWVHQIMLKKEVIEKVGFFDESFISLEDVDYVYRLRKFYTFGFIDEPLLIYHNTPGSLGKDIEKRNKARELFIRKHRTTLSRRSISKMLYSAGKDYLTLGKVKKSINCFSRAYFIYPLNQQALRKMIKTLPLILKSKFR
ncbi:MAG: glycosyltransferase family 2 protein [bacterium]|nr:glycosyltransferase family 2 protein [bacterium]